MAAGSRQCRWTHSGSWRRDSGRSATRLPADQPTPKRWTAICAPARHPQAWRAQLWLSAGNRGPLTASGIYQAGTRRAGSAGWTCGRTGPGHHFSHTWLERGGPEGDLMELNSWSSPQMLASYGASARRTYDRIMTDSP